MNRIFISISLIFLFVACSPEQSGTGDEPKPSGLDPELIDTPDLNIVDIPKPIPQVTDISNEAKQAKTAIGIFSKSLSSELKTAMVEGGPLNAIEVCNSSAMPITKQVSAEQGLELSRVSLKNRNPANAPNDWQKQTLELFEQQQASGADPATLVWSSIADVYGEKQFRYMKAIPTAAICLTCHGRNIAPDVSEKLAELYPDDKATGYSEGELRGAFVVTQNLP